jgi:hypothetical protein
VTAASVSTRQRRWKTHFENRACVVKGEKKVAAERDKSQNRQSYGAETAKSPDF